MTQQIRAGLQAEGILGADSFTLKGLHRKDLTTAQASYVTAYAPGDVLVPIQDYRKQGLWRGEQYTAVDKDSHQLALETPSESVMSVDPVVMSSQDGLHVPGDPHSSRRQVAVDTE